MAVLVMSTLLLMLVYSASLVMGWTCRGLCGSLQVKYPFGTGPGCGDPRFQTYITCHNQRQLIFTSHTGSYPIQDIDYNKHVIHIKDPFMSTCNSMQPSRSFGLDWAAPFRIKNDAFVLLGCSPTSCLYDPHNYLCDIGSAHICSSLYACPGIGGLDLPIHAPITSCCVYSPINLGPAVEMNLSRLQCLSYTNIYSFGGDLTNPSQWRYGVALEYNYNINNYIPSSCRECEESNGVCGYSGPYETFVCVCMNGINTTTNCYGQDYLWDEAFSKRSISMILIAGVISMVGILLLQG
ncbi:hypothetical protein SUGI_0641150 [Cryptomeria japonica]|nr:hypothetical protein SUGI_0641150 [Cryptomeria japonica]